MLWTGLAYSSMPSLTGWQAQFAVSLQHYGQMITNALSWIPNWMGVVVLLVIISLLAWYALRQVGTHADDDQEAQMATGEGHDEEVKTIEETGSVAIQEEPVEH